MESFQFAEFVVGAIDFAMALLSAHPTRVEGCHRPFVRDSGGIPEILEMYENHKVKGDWATPDTRPNVSHIDRQCLNDIVIHRHLDSSIDAPHNIHKHHTPWRRRRRPSKVDGWPPLRRPGRGHSVAPVPSSLPAEKRRKRRHQRLLLLLLLRWSSPEFLILLLFIDASEEQRQDRVMSDKRHTPRGAVADRRITKSFFTIRRHLLTRPSAAAVALPSSSSPSAYR